MHTEKHRVTVDYVNPPKPGRKMGNINTKEQGLVFVWPNLLDQFQPGVQYDIEISVTPGDDPNKPFKRFEKIVPAQETAAPAQPVPPQKLPEQAPALQPPAYDQRAEDIFVAGVVNNAVRAGQINMSGGEHGVMQELIHWSLAAQKAFKVTHGVTLPSDGAPDSSYGMDDEIPF